MSLVLMEVGKKFLPFYDRRLWKCARKVSSPWARIRGIHGMAACGWVIGWSDMYLWVESGLLWGYLIQNCGKAINKEWFTTDILGMVGGWLKSEDVRRSIGVGKHAAEHVLSPFMLWCGKCWWPINREIDLFPGYDIFEGIQTNNNFSA